MVDALGTSGACFIGGALPGTGGGEEVLAFEAADLFSAAGAADLGADDFALAGSGGGGEGLGRAVFLEGPAPLGAAEGLTSCVVGFAGGRESMEETNST